jgi:hypothetical protein
MRRSTPWPQTDRTTESMIGRGVVTIAQASLGESLSVISFRDGRIEAAARPLASGVGS